VVAQRVAELREPLELKGVSASAQSGDQSGDYYFQMKRGWKLKKHQNA
jgi:hypothetical protein